MLRFFIILLLCALFAACSSDNDSDALNKWFSDKGIATSYGKTYQEIEVSLKDSDLGYDSSAYMVGTYAALGNVNNLKQILYFGLETTSSLSSVWNLKLDSIFYANFYGGEVPEEHKKLEARFYWLKESNVEHDTTWLKFQNKFTDSADISINSFKISLPSKFLELKADTLRVLAGIKLLTDNAVLRIAAPTTTDIPGLLRVAQKTSFEQCGNLCLRAGVRESLNVVLEAGKDKIDSSKTIVFAQLVLPKSGDATGNELGYPVPVYVYNESYIVDTTFVEAYGHPNLLFWESDTLKLQVTRNLRNHALDTLTLRFGNPVLNPKSSTFSTTSRPAYSKYDFSTAFEGAKLRLWYAD